MAEGRVEPSLGEPLILPAFLLQSVCASGNGRFDRSAYSSLGQGAERLLIGLGPPVQTLQGRGDHLNGDLHRNRRQVSNGHEREGGTELLGLICPGGQPLQVDAGDKICGPTPRLDRSIDPDAAPCPIG